MLTLKLRIFVSALLIFIIVLSIRPVDAMNPVLVIQTWMPTSGPSSASAVALDGFGNVYLGGFENNSALLLKYNASGSLLWTAAWGGSNGTTGLSGLALGSSGEIYAVGETSSFGNGGYDLLLLKYYANGSFGWARIWGGSQDDTGSAVAVDSLGNIYATGGTASYGSGPENAVILKFTPSGSLVWAKTWGGSNGSFGTSLAVDSSGVYVVGYEGGSGISGNHAFLLELNPTDGSPIFQKGWGGSGNDYAYGLTLDTLGAIYMTGTTNSYGISTDAFILKFDSIGNLLWQRSWGGSNPSFGWGIAHNSMNAVYAVGRTSSFGSLNGTAFILEISSAGNLVTQEIWGAQSTRQPGTVAHAVTVDSAANAFVAGSLVAPPPYSLGTSNSSLGIPNLTLSNLNITASSASKGVRTPVGITNHPLGSSTFTGEQAAFFVELSGAPPTPVFPLFTVPLLILLIIPVLEKARKSGRNLNLRFPASSSDAP